ncbi:MAG: cysteine desulfurase family protein [Bacteroidota bacterium]
MEKPAIYFDYAASTPLDPEVFEAMKPYLLGQGANPSSTHQHGRRLRTAVEQARRKIAQLLNAQAYEIVFTSGGTEADNTALKGMVHAMGIQHIISSPIEHHAVTHTIKTLEKAGHIQAHWLKVDSQGQIDREALRDLLKQYPGAIVSLMHGNNELGNIYELQEIAEESKEYGAYIHSDTVQTMGNVTYDLQVLPIDFLAASAHKFYGPKGMGFLFVRKGTSVSALIDGGSQEQALRAGTENVASIVGMAHALEKRLQNLSEKQASLQKLKSRMKDLLLENFPGVRFNGFQEQEKSLPKILNVTFPGEEDRMLPFHLDIKGISVSGGSACSSGARSGSFVLRELGHKEHEALNSVRFSFGLQSTEEEIDYTVDTLKEILDKTLQKA